ncbi:MAG: tRNA (adenosine(37)-N6)-threonylcarbamoyltransferase complex transferase subunit TsaD [Bacteroidetes bacterium]|nr:tRNA (adenosine(37)-N6)-threonylcarbamoyltransferase complex transferase subunit TsaD [Bacteroidota bacterium]
MKSDIFILAIESSCDDTSAAVLKNKTVLSNVIATQKIHEEYGGVVPELASRAHQQNIVPVVKSAMDKSGIALHQLSGIAFTRGPGLLGSLLVGTSFAKGLSINLGIPLIEVNHMKAHILSHLIDNNNYDQEVEFPILCLTVSGGHTQLVVVSSPYDFKVVGETIDDAAGEAFDKIAKTIGLPYPGGPLIDKLAKEGNPKAFKFPISVVKDLDYSFSGLKTSVLYFLQKEVNKNPHFIEENKADLCASVQYTIIQTLLKKLKMAIEMHQPKSIALAGGVSANSELRTTITELGKELGIPALIPAFEYCTDNAAMIGISGYFNYLNKDFSDLSVTASARLAV